MKIDGRDDMCFEFEPGEEQIRAESSEIGAADTNSLKKTRELHIPLSKRLESECAKDGNTDIENTTATPRSHAAAATEKRESKCATDVDAVVMTIEVRCFVGPATGERCLRAHDR